MITNSIVPVATENHRRLEALLLPYGGRELVCLTETDEDWQTLFRLGKHIIPTKVLLKRGERSNCHENALKLCLNHPGEYRYATGYALSDDGLWRQHSWVVRKDEAIIETTVKRQVYFGYLPAKDEQ